MKKYKINNVGRFMRAILLSILTIVLAFSTNFNNVEAEIQETEEYSVRKGDTIWRIANKISEGEINTHQVIYDINKLNGNITEESNIKTGQIIILPKY